MFILHSVKILLSVLQRLWNFPLKMCSLLRSALSSPLRSIWSILPIHPTSSAKCNFSSLMQQIQHLTNYTSGWRRKSRTQQEKLILKNFLSCRSHQLCSVQMSNSVVNIMREQAQTFQHVSDKCCHNKGDIGSKNLNKCVWGWWWMCSFIHREEGLL